MNWKCLFKHDWVVHRQPRDAGEIAEGVTFTCGTGIPCLLFSILFLVNEVYPPAFVLLGVALVCGFVLVRTFLCRERDASCLRCGKHVYGYAKRELRIKEQKRREEERKDAARKAATEHKKGRLEALDKWLEKSNGA